MKGRDAVLALLAAMAAAGCAAGEIRYPGRADVRAGDRPLITIEPTASTETSPSVLRVPVGTEVTWRNTSPELVFIRFRQPIDRVCGKPIRFGRTYDGASFSTPFLPPFADARLCFASPGRYDFVVSSNERGGGSRDGLDLKGNGLSPVRYGTVVVE